MVIIKKINRLLKKKLDYRHPETYGEELNAQCKVLLIPTAFLALGAWIPFLLVDKILYPQYPIILYLRGALSPIGLAALVLNFLSLEKLNANLATHKSYFLTICIIGYLELASGVIVGLVGADPVYMGGYALVVVCSALLPFKIKHAIIMLCLSLCLFLVMRFYSGMNFTSGHAKYGLFNLIEAVTVAGIGAFYLGYIRKSRYHANLLIQKKSDEIMRQYLQTQGISRREQDIIGLLMIGKSSEDIEKMLFISTHTVKNHIYNIYRKLGIKNRAQLLSQMQNVRSKW
jgi:DNA-binding CsgD family transcriptional regulator